MYHIETVAYFLFQSVYYLFQMLRQDIAFEYIRSRIHEFVLIRKLAIYPFSLDKFSTP